MSNCMHHSHFQCNRLLAIFLASFLATLMLTMLVYSTSAAQGDNGNNAGKDIILLIDNSGSMILGTPGGDDPTDPDELRIRISRFIINLLNHLGAPDVRVGAITFAQASTVRVPLTPVEEWTEEDLNAIVGEHEGQVTEFAEALNAAQQMLLGPDGAIDPDREIEIWLLTDADLNESLAGTVDIYISQLRDIVNTSYTEKTTIRILSFEDDNVDNWNTIFSDVSSAYFSLLDHTLEETFHYVLTSTAGVRAADYTSVSVSGTHHINQPVQPYQNWVRFTILPENPVTTSFTLDDHYLEPYVSGHNYFFPQPDRGDWQVHLQSSEPSIVFYQFVADPSPFFIYPELVEVQAINQPLEVRAVLANSVIGEIQPGPDFEVSATLTSGNNQILTPLQPGPGFYSATIPIDQLSPGVYSLVVEVQGRDDFSNFTAYDDTRTVHLVEPPQIGEIDMESTTSDEPLKVTVPVSGWQTLLEQKITLELKDGTGATITSTEAAGTRGTFHWNPPAQSAGVYEIIASIAPSNLPLPYLATSEHQLFTISDSGVTSVPKNYQFTVGEVSLAPEDRKSVV